MLQRQAKSEEHLIMFPRFESNNSNRKLKKKFAKNYFGMPIYALGDQYDGLVYQSRKQLDVEEEEEDVVPEESNVKAPGKVRITNDLNDEENETNKVAQRKVAKALLTMCSNQHMAVHFITKGGLEAIFKMIAESNDHDVLSTCSACLSYASKAPETCIVLANKNVLVNLNMLIESGDNNARLHSSIVLSNMTKAEGQENNLYNKGIILTLQTMLSNTEERRIVAYTLLCLTNIASIFGPGPDAEITVRMMNQMVKRLDILHDMEAAVFVGEVFNNFCKISSYSSLLVEEGIMVMLVAILEAYQTSEVFEKCIESFFYLSLNRKNRREIVSSGVHHHFPKLFSIGHPATCAYCLLMIGNLLQVDLYHDKVGQRDDIILLILSMLNPEHSKQFIAAAYCLCQLAQLHVSAEVLVRNNILGVILDLLPESDNREANSYMWTTLVHLSQNHDFFVKMIEQKNLVPEMFKEANYPNSDLKPCLAQLAVNLSQQAGLHMLLEHENVVLLVKTCKLLFSTSELDIRDTILTALNNVAVCVPAVRGEILNTDLIHLFEQAGFDDKDCVLKYCALLNIISNEESCCMKLLENGVQRLLITLQDKFSAGTHGKDVTAAILHNMSLKRGTMSSGVLSTLLLIVKNCKESRVLWAVRAIANFSAHSKSRLQLTKEKNLIPILNGIMRYGCEQADRVQHYCAIAICNILSTTVDKDIIEHLVTKGGVVDLVVVTLLRVNSGSTKEFLGKALFNLLCRADFRERLVQLDVLEAVVELGKIENLELLDICVKCVYNVSCEGDRYAKHMDELRLVDMLCLRAAGSMHIGGYKATTSVRLTCAMALANMSFNKSLATNICNCDTTGDAMHSISNLDSDEAIYCLCVTMFNCSFLSAATSLSLTHKPTSLSEPVSILKILVSILTRGPVLCIQLSMAALSNLSLKSIFHEELTQVAMSVIIKEILLQASMDIAIKLDALKLIYNVVVAYPFSRAIVIEADCVVALSKLLKINDDEYTIRLIGRIVKELCAETQLHKKLMSDGIMGILLKLSKIEISLLKLDLSCAIYSISTVPDTMKVLKWDGVDILFWLTLHDCLNLYDPIRLNCGKALRNLSVNTEEAKALVKEDRFATVLHALVKSRNEDVLWEAAGILYNLMSIDECKQVMLQRNAIQLIFDIASSNYTNVRHICSACLHMSPDHMPNMEDPEVLQLVLCLLEVDSGDQFSSLGEKCTEKLKDDPNITNWEGAIVPAGTNFTHRGTNFAASWLTVPQAVDKHFTPVLLNLHFESATPILTKVLVSGSGTFETSAHKMLPEEFNDFANFGGSTGTGTGRGVDHGFEEGGVYGYGEGQYEMDYEGFDRREDIGVQPLQLEPPAPYGSNRSSPSHTTDHKRNRNTILVKQEAPNRESGKKYIEPVRPSSVTFPKIHGHENNRHETGGLKLSNGGRGIPDDTLLTLKTSFNREQKKKTAAEIKAQKAHEGALYPSSGGLNYTSTDFGNTPLSMIAPSSPHAKHHGHHGQDARGMNTSHVQHEGSMLSVGGKSSVSHDHLLLGRSIHDSFPSSSNHSGSAAPRMVTSAAEESRMANGESFSGTGGFGGINSTSSSMRGSPVSSSRKSRK